MRVLAAALLIAGPLVPNALAAQAGVCPDGMPAQASFGIRYRFTAGDFNRPADAPAWIHFLTEPLVTEVDPTGPVHGILRAGDVIVAVDGHLITTTEGSRSFFTMGDRPVDLRLRRNGGAIAVRVAPRQTCDRLPTVQGLRQGDPPP